MKPKLRQPFCEAIAEARDHGFMSDSSAPDGTPLAPNGDLKDTLRPAPGQQPGHSTIPSPGQFHVGQSSSGQILLAPGFKPAFEIQDLTTDPLLSGAPRASVLGRYVPTLDGIPVLYKLGQGGMGAVYYGYHPRLDREVAVKVLPQQMAAQNPDLVQRFFREARIAAKVRSPHLVGVLDVDQDGGLFFIVMEFVSGGSVRGYVDKLKKQGRTGMDEVVALDICIAAAKGLAEAHAQGVVHRDIKPDNILLPTGKDNAPAFADAKLADLGLARGEGQDTGLTLAHASMGTPGYLAPEQATDAHTAAAPADVYGMGASLYAMLAGHAPFTGTSAMKIMMDTVQKPHEPISKLRPDVSPDTAAVLDKCLAKNAAQRYAHGGELLPALTSCRAKYGPAPLSGVSVGTGLITAISQPTAGTTAVPLSAASVQTNAATAMPSRTSSGMALPVKLLLGCIGVCVLGGGLIFGGLMVIGFKLHANMEAPVQGQLDDLKRGNFDAAYEKTSKEFRQSTSRSEFERFVKDYVALSKFQSLKISDHDYKTNSGTIKGTITSTDNSTSDVEYAVVEEDGAWKIQNIRVRGPTTNLQAEEDPSSNRTIIVGITSGTEVDAKGVLKSTKVTFNQSDGTIYINVRILKAVAGSRITAAISQSGGTYKAGPFTQSIALDGTVVSGFYFTPPTSGWPKGRFEISAYISGGVSSKHTIVIR